MKKPAHANADAMTVLVFERNSRKAVMEATGTDPNHIAKTIAAHSCITDPERRNVRTKVREALDAVAGKAIPNLTDAQIQVGARRFRIKAAA